MSIFCVVTQIYGPSDIIKVQIGFSMELNVVDGLRQRILVDCNRLLQKV